MRSQASPEEQANTAAWIEAFAAAAAAAPAAPAAPPASAPEAALRLVCVPTFVFADGRKAYLTVRLRPGAEGSRLVAFQSRRDAEAAGAFAEDWPQFAGARFTVVPRVAAEMEAVALARGASLLSVPPAGASAMAGVASEEDLARWLRGDPTGADGPRTSEYGLPMPDDRAGPALSGNTAEQDRAEAREWIARYRARVSAPADDPMAAVVAAARADAEARREARAQEAAAYAALAERVAAARAALPAAETSTAAFEAEAADAAAVAEHLAGFLEAAAASTASAAETAPASARPAGPWYHALPFLAAPVAVYGDGTHGFFATPGGALVAFESRAAAEAFAAERGATVVPAYPKALERFAMARGLALDVARAEDGAGQPRRKSRRGRSHESRFRSLSDPGEVVFCEEELKSHDWDWDGTVEFTADELREESWDDLIEDALA